MTFSEEQEQLRSSVRRFLENKSPETEVRRLMETDEGYERAVWEQMATQLGLQGLVIPEEYGGSGYTAVELGIVLEEMGRALLCAPYLSTVVLAAGVLMQCDDATKKEFLPRIAAGETIATLALTEESGRWDETGITTAARRAGEDWVLDGHKLFVLDGHVADLLLVAARTDDGLAVFAVEGGANGLERELMTTMDQTRKQAGLRFSGTPARLAVPPSDGWRVLQHALDRAAVALANEQVGGAQQCLEMSVAYAKERVQFGRPIGSFQAVKHKCADMLLDVEQAKSAAYCGSAAFAEGSHEAPLLASLAKAYCSEAYFRVASETIQVHGGIGFTWEHPAHLYFKRAKSTEIYLGDPNHHRELLVQRLGITR